MSQKILWSGLKVGFEIHDYLEHYSRYLASSRGTWHLPDEERNLSWPLVLNARYHYSSNCFSFSGTLCTNEKSGT